ncbi:zinc ribbon domain-containing protein [Candidatus Aminicenantes bacterium AC-708-M15]|nr:zinc ribbon domain-containing protein [SCandidatus Aminicenantes bacterium Aminicenantia_JdfR_composite]MCP2598159.1 zinc ribbon domain-containing protein [Candidatus Aminicenantes bacterium AC-335-L06]MCP2598907.1 zinc ribbon domain-containing protein [Candidatus Aminicenantes bacterium AC-335-B20]MCP2603852.1 zinc ribbon domain-containing protein [Candidatus Aminicenantes bacterium AC-708-M15]MCP2605632.1 zinc ribbon domain-containing protein [Candidatus Aminicenantes bacterium AC-335-O07]
MPIYEFQCKKCGEKFEILVIGKDMEISCPKCKSSDITKLISSFGIGGSSNKQTGSSNLACSSCSTKSCSTCK